MEYYIFTSGKIIHILNPGLKSKVETFAFLLASFGRYIWLQIISIALEICNLRTNIRRGILIVSN